MKAHVLSLFLLGCLLASSAAAAESFEQELSKFEGTWKPISMEMDGKFLGDDQIGKTRLTIKGENFTFDTGRDSHAGLYKINPEADPKELNIEITRGDEQGKVYLVIYKFDGDKMVQCMKVSNEGRPAKFTGKKGSGNLLEYWERVK